MSWFKRESPLRASFGRRSPSKLKPPDPEACLESFKKHCQQACTIINKHGHSELEAQNLPPPSLDDVTIAISNLSQMVTLLIQEIKEMSQENGLRIGPMLDYLMTEGILDKLYLWSFRTGEFCNDMKLEQLKIYEVLLSNSAHELLVHKPVLRPLLKLLASCKDCAPVEVEKRLIVLLNQLCVSLTQNATLLEYFFSASNDQGSARFLIFSLLIPFVHREGGIGQQARDALLLCMALSRRNDGIGNYIADSSNFCPVLATGLSGLYSRLPRKLDIKSEDWCLLSSDDIQEIPELLMFMNSLEFCNAVVQVSHPKVQEQLLDYVYQGFLVPVLAPALHQDTMGLPIEGMKSSSKYSSCIEEIETATAYLDLFIRTVTDPALIHSFLKFVLTEKFDFQVIINTLISRINSHPRLSLITMSLFKTMLELNCEDVMLELVFKYLLPCNHVMVSQRCRLRDNDIYSQTTAKFLALVPACCTVRGPKPVRPASPSPQRPIQSSQSDYTLYSGKKNRLRTGSVASVSSHNITEMENFPPQDATNETCTSNYMNYLHDARVAIRNCVSACESWSDKYDGEASQQPSHNQDHKFCAKNNESASHCASSEPRSIIESDPSKKVSSKPLENGFAPHQNGVDDEKRDFWSVIAACKVDTMADLEETLDKLNSFLRGNFKSLEFRSKESILKRCTISSLRELQEVNTGDSSKSRAFSCPADKSSIKGGLHHRCSFGSPDIGPFLGVLFTKLENMMNNSIYVNLLLTGLIVRLAVYPQPLLKSFLLSHNLVFQPSVRSLSQVLGSLKHKLDTFSYTEASFQDMLLRARQFLLAREERYSQDGNSSSTDNGRTKLHYYSPLDSSRPEGRRRSLSTFLFRRGTVLEERNTPTIRESSLESISDGQGYRYFNKRSSEAPEGRLEWLKTKNAVLCAIVLEEFVKELAAVSQEHLIADADAEYYDMSYIL